MGKVTIKDLQARIDNLEIKISSIEKIITSSNENKNDIPKKEIWKKPSNVARAAQVYREYKIKKENE